MWLNKIQPMISKNVQCTKMPIPANEPILQDHFIALVFRGSAVNFGFILPSGILAADQRDVVDADFVKPANVFQPSLGSGSCGGHVFLRWEE